ERLKEVRRLHRRRGRDRAGRFVAEGEDLLAAADAAGWPALERYCAAGSGLAGVEVEPEALAAASTLGSGTRALAVYEQRWAAPARACRDGSWTTATGSPTSRSPTPTPSTRRWPPRSRCTSCPRIGWPADAGADRHAAQGGRGGDRRGRLERRAGGAARASPG